MRGYQDRAAAWAVTCFGVRDAQNQAMRSQRFLEETLQLVDYVYSRPRRPSPA